MARTGIYKQGQFMAYRVEDDGSISQAFYTPGTGGGWGHALLSGPRASSASMTKDAAVPGRNVSKLDDYSGVDGRVDITADAVGGGFIHCWYTPGAGGGWSSERIPTS